MRSDEITKRARFDTLQIMPREFSTNAEYEGKYQDAVATLRGHGKTVGKPEIVRGGIRSVHVDGFPCTDELVFEKAWGKDAAQEIMASRPR